ncbi:hypothetical protein KEM52_002997 [Ascosphaera acerosa]|nr:hypothetical protein KEM52_002997 [Ascosphaera acerosa]
MPASFSSVAAADAAAAPEAVRLVVRHHQPAVRDGDPAFLFEEVYVAEGHLLVVISQGLGGRPVPDVLRLDWAFGREVRRLADLRPQQRAVAVSQLVGVANATPCECCASGRNRWLDCKSAPAVAPDRSCASCRWHGKPDRCSLRVAGPSSPRKRKAAPSADVAAFRRLRAAALGGRHLPVEGWVTPGDEATWRQVTDEAETIAELCRLRLAKFEADKEWN